MRDTTPASVPDLANARRAVELKDAGALALCLGRLRGAAADHRLFEKARLFVEDGAAGVIALLANEYAEVVERAHMASAVGAIGDYSGLSKAQDFIAQESGASEWSVDQMLCRLTFERSAYRQGSAAVVGTMRDDGIYILEWVAHYRALGFEHLLIYTNDNADGSDALLNCLAQHKLLTVVQNEVTGEVPPEVKAFGHAMNLQPRLWKYEWALFVDSDEFLMPAQRMGGSVGDIVSQLENVDPDREFGAILFDWRWYVSEYKFRRMPGTLIDRFAYARDHHIGKCLVRLRDTLSMRRQHCPDLIEGKALCDSAFNVVDMDMIWSRATPEYSGGQINHYWPKSFEEFAIKKARGAAFGGENNAYDRPYRKFFEWNGSAESCTHCPADPMLVAAMHREMKALRALPGVEDTQAEVEAGYARRLASICSPEVLHALYEHNRVPPGPL